MIEHSKLNELSLELVLLLGTDQQIEPFSKELAGFDLDAAYSIVDRVRDLRRGRGEVTVGRKIGFTNRAIWASQGISAPIWNYVFDTTFFRAESGLAKAGLDVMPEPRIEPEVVLHLGAAPEPGMTDAGLFGCIDWIAPGFEVVYSVFPDWDFTAADAAAAYGVHGKLFIGETLDVTRQRPQRQFELETFTVRLTDGESTERSGKAENVLGSPLQALRFLVEEIARYPGNEALKAGEVVTTGTLTEALPLRRGQTWQAEFSGIDFKPIRLQTV